MGGVTCEWIKQCTEKITINGSVGSAEFSPGRNLICTCTSNFPSPPVNVVT